MYSKCSLCHAGLIYRGGNEGTNCIYILNLMSRKTILSFDPQNVSGGIHYCTSH